MLSTQTARQFTTEPSRPLAGPALCLTGPTAVGKSDVALALAERLNAEIIVVDSMQVYRGMDIGTAKPSSAERQRITHHLLDIVELSQQFNAAEFVRLAEAAVEQVRARGKLPLLCGGTGLYFKALLEGLGQAPPADPQLRAELESLGLEVLLQELAQHDPATYARIDRQNPRRVVRAVEVLRLTGKPWSQQRATWTAPPATPACTVPVFGLTRSPSDLRHRIERRVDQMFAAGLVAETERLLQAGLGSNPVALQALGYHQVAEFLKGNRSLPATIELVKIRTRQFAKRQMTWFRRQLPLRWINCEPEQQAESIAERLISEFKAWPTDVKA